MIIQGGDEMKVAVGKKRTGVSISSLSPRNKMKPRGTAALDRAHSIKLLLARIDRILVVLAPLAITTACLLVAGLRINSMHKLRSSPDAVEAQQEAVLDYFDLYPFNEPLSKLNVWLSKTIYHLGWDEWDGPPDQMHSQLIAILHTLDKVFDEQGEISTDGSSCNGIIAVSGWALTTLRQVFFNETDITEWGLTLEQHLPIVLFDRIKDRTGKRAIVKVHSNAAYHYVKTSRSLLSTVAPEIPVRRRRLILGQFFSHVNERHFDDYNTLKSQLTQSTMNDEPWNDIGENYVALHAHSLDEQCEFSNIPDEECVLNPEYIKNILRPLHLVGRIHIVVIGETANENALVALQSDPDIGQNVIIPAWEDVVSIPGSIDSQISDMMIASKSDIFIGTKTSSTASLIGAIRVALGADPQSNYIYVKQIDPSYDDDYNTDDGVVVGEEDKTPEMHVCGDCIFLCDDPNSSLCKNSATYR